MVTGDSAYELIQSVADASSFGAGPQVEAVALPLTLDAPVPYADRLRKAREETGLLNGVVWGEAGIGGTPAVLLANDWRFLGGSVGVAETKTLVAAFEAAVQKNLPVVWLARGGGSRMQECAHSLAALSQALAARNVLAAKHLPLITVAMDPLFGGSNLLAMQGDVVLAIAGARIGYAGIRVVEMMEPKPLPDRFQTAEWAYRNGHVDAVVAVEDLQGVLADVLHLLSPDGRAPVAEATKPESDFVQRSAWECVESSRSPDNLPMRELLDEMAEQVFELRGDRICGDDPAVLGAIVRMEGQRFVMIGHAGVHAVEDRIRHNLNAPHPSGHRKALRLVRLAERLGLPILTMIDSPGAHADVLSEAEGQGYVLGQLIGAMLEVQVPTIGLIAGEGISAAALALASTDQLMMTDASWYSVIAPEGAAAILWGDPEKKIEAAAALGLAPSDLLKVGLVDMVVPSSPKTGDFASILRSAILRSFQRAKEAGPSLAKRSRAKRA